MLADWNIRAVVVPVSHHQGGLDDLWPPIDLLPLFISFNPAEFWLESNLIILADVDL